MSPWIHQSFTFILLFFPALAILPCQSSAGEIQTWEGSVILVHDSGRDSSRSYKRWLREQKKLERRLEREQNREARRQARNRYSRGSGYYPDYRSKKNPVVDTEEYWEEGYAPDGTYHSQEVTEDRHQSYYSPGRQEAVTPPNTTEDAWTYGDGTVKSRERTTWIGSDGRYHSTTINRTTQTDEEGNSHTETHVDLKRQATSSPSSPSAQSASPAPKPPETIPSSSKAEASSSPSTNIAPQASSQASPPPSSSSSSSSSKTEAEPKPTEAGTDTPSAPPQASP
jgi:hypothetical protein